MPEGSEVCGTNTDQFHKVVKLFSGSFGIGFWPAFQKIVSVQIPDSPWVCCVLCSCKYGCQV